MVSTTPVFFGFVLLRAKDTTDFDEAFAFGGGEANTPPLSDGSLPLAMTTGALLFTGAAFVLPFLCPTDDGVLFPFAILHKGSD